MKKVILYSLPLMLAGSVCCATANAGNGIIARQDGNVTELVNSLKNKRHAAPVVRAYGFAGSASGIARTAAEPFSQMQGTVADFLVDEDGNRWYYTQENTYSSSAYGASISKAVIKVYDNSHELAGTINVDIPDGMSVNAISPYGTITKKFFDLNDKTSELLVELHETGNADNNYQGKYHTRAYHLDGTVAAEYEGAGVFLSIVKNSYTKYQRLVMTNAKLEEVEGKTYDDGSPYKTTMDNIDIYKPASWGTSAPSVEKSFKIDEDYTYYGSDGVPMSIYNIGGEPYYVISHYSKIYDSGETDSETGFFVPTKDNSVVIQSYDKNFNLVDNLDIPIEPASDTDYRMAQIGNFEDLSVTKNLFTNDGSLSYVLTFYDMTTKVDDYRYKFTAYDHTGNKIGDICDGVYNTWFKLKSISGAEDQVAFMQYVDDDETQQQIKIVNVPSLTEAATMPAYIDGNLISTVFNRYGDKDNYKYLMKISQGDDDGQGNVIAKIAWLNKDLTVDHYTKFNLGPNAENFSLTLADTYVNPYLFNTTDKMEFFFQAKVKEENGSKIDNVYMIADEDGNVLHRFTNGDKGTISSVGCYRASGSDNEMYVAYYDETSKQYTLDFYKLPLSKFDKGGNGTKDNPYLVATAGDLAAVAYSPSACYKMVDDINMDTYNSVNASWTPVGEFSGTFDGDNHYIANLQLNNDKASSIGLFGDLGENAEVKNLVFTAPQITLNDNNACVGTLAGNAVGNGTEDGGQTSSCAIKNVHVYDAAISGQNVDAVIGGLVGQASLYASISEASFNNSSIDAPKSSSVGGIVGDMRTKASVEAAAVSGATINAASYVGGIVGSAMKSTVRNSRASGKICAENNVGGIVGNNSETVTDKCIFDGTVKASKAGWSGLAAAGIIGSLDSDWTNSTKAIITNNIAKGSVEAAEGAEDLATGTMHRIVGKTIANEEDNSGKTEQRLSNNWAVNTMTVNGKTVTSVDETSVEGYDAAESDISAESLSQIGYGFGTTTDAPWKDSGSALPVLFFENEAKALVLSRGSIAMTVDETTDALSVTAYGSDANEVVVTSSDENVVEILEENVDGNTTVFSLHAKKDGTADITVALGDISVVCKVTVGSATAISKTTANAAEKVRIIPADGYVKADGAVKMNVYSVDGGLAARANGSAVCTRRLGKGMFIVEAVDADGNKTAAKVVIR